MTRKPIDELTISDSVSIEESEAIVANVRERIRDEARAQAEAEFKEIKHKALLAQMLEEERAKLRPPEKEPDPLVPVTIDVPPNMFVNQANETGLVIDGRAYIHGTTYQVSRSLSNDLRHLMFRANHNEKSMGSPNRDVNRRKVIDARAGQVLLDPRVT